MPGVMQCQFLVVLAGLELLGGTEIILRIEYFQFFLHQQMRSASLSHYAHMAWGCWHCGLKFRTRGTSVDVGSSIFQQCPYP